jgi:hypothetical protein
MDPTRAKADVASSAEEMRIDFIDTIVAILLVVLLLRCSVSSERMSGE